jgi:light-regulated signal transduction histidine kinase (bacteriophytochrome)
VASHDLQEPLRTVSSCLQLLKKRYDGKLDARADEFIAHAVSGSQRMRNLIDDLLTLSRINAATQNLVLTDSARVFDEVRANLAHAIEESGAQLTYEGLPKVMASPQMLSQLFQNLVSNALKFAGGRVPVVHFSAKRVGRHWLFSVADQGIGIEAQHFERIFRLFQRLHTRDECPGTGLGLAICQKIVTRHGGRIWVKSSPNGGATFFFTMPAMHTPQTTD